MPGAVLLEHRETDGGIHFDWMLEDQACADERRLWTWRVRVRVDASGVFEAERIGQHRSAYLRFEGEIAGGRGWVRRIACGRIVSATLHESGVRAQVIWANRRPIVYEGKPMDSSGRLWRFTGVLAPDSTLTA